MFRVVVETQEFVKRASECMDEQLKQNFISFIAKNPLAGDLIPGTGGTRKIRWANDLHKGKRGGARIIYYYYNESFPIFLFTAYAKNQKDNLSAQEKKALYKITKMIVETYESE
ncbi:MAG: type II toxin-antitoxin system RelE/ParE family toxin [Proteobacteria bacterium]|nr:type II toxin-antitoxin system RelE/ParE family toxin [Pseudomonadota bacterium]